MHKQSCCLISLDSVMFVGIHVILTEPEFVRHCVYMSLLMLAFLVVFIDLLTHISIIIGRINSIKRGNHY